MLGGQGRPHISRPGSSRAGPRGGPVPPGQVRRGHGHGPWPEL